MTDSVIIKDKTGALSVDLTGSAGVTRQGSNPMILITIPAETGASSRDWTTDGGAESINLKMLSDRITITFKLTDGVGTHRNCTCPAEGGSYYSTAEGSYTKYEKLWQLFKYDLSKKMLFIGSSGTSPDFWVEMETLTTPLLPGAKQFLESCSMTLNVVNKDDE